MWLAIAITALVVVFALCENRRQSRENRRVMLHTIAVNLSILKPELDELEGIAKSADESTSVEKARELIKSARDTASKVDGRAFSAATRELGGLLSNVFSAMGKATEARRLLGAIESMTDMRLE